MSETPQNIFHDAVPEPYKGFLRLVERLSVGPGQPDEFHEDDDMYIMESGYAVQDDSPFLPIQGLKVSFKLREVAQWQHRMAIELGLGKEATEVVLLHAHWLQPVEWYRAEGNLTEALADVADTDYFADDAFFGQTVNRIEELETACKLELQS